MSYACPSGYTYNSLKTECKRRILPSDCSTVKYASNTDQYVAYPGDPSLYALCLVTDGTLTPIVFRCADPLNEQFIQAQGRCVFQCKKEGRVPDGKDCSRYFECFRYGLNYVSLHQKCLNGFIFNVEVNGCVRGKCPVDDEEETGSGTEIPISKMF